MRITVRWAALGHRKKPALGHRPGRQQPLSLGREQYCTRERERLGAVEHLYVTTRYDQRDNTSKRSRDNQLDRSKCAKDTHKYFKVQQQSIIYILFWRRQSISSNTVAGNTSVL